MSGRCNFTCRQLAWEHLGGKVENLCCTDLSTFGGQSERLNEEKERIETTLGFGLLALQMLGTLESSTLVKPT